LAKSWSCEEITPGLWDDQIQEELESSDIVVFLMSMNFAASDYVLKEEVYRTFEQMAKNPDKKIVCVLVRYFPWSYFESLKDIFNIKDEINDEDKAGFALANLSNYQFLPYYYDKKDDETKDKRYLKPIAEWQYKERAYSQIVEVLGKLI
jgi:internalin A